MKVSVIVAAYNAEKYVTETMESLANQSIDDYEIIVAMMVPKTTRLTF